MVMATHERQRRNGSGHIGFYWWCHHSLHTLSLFYFFHYLKTIKANSKCTPWHYIQACYNFLMGRADYQLFGDFHWIYSFSQVYLRGFKPIVWWIKWLVASKIIFTSKLKPVVWLLIFLEDKNFSSENGLFFQSFNNTFLGRHAFTLDSSSQN